LPRGTKPKKLSSSKTLKMFAGSLAAAEVVTRIYMRLSEFDKIRCIDEQKAIVFDSSCKYDIIFGTDFLTKVVVNIKLRTGFMD